jgi:hypothetical protein
MRTVWRRRESRNRQFHLLYWVVDKRFDAVVNTAARGTSLSKSVSKMLLTFAASEQVFGRAGEQSDRGHGPA